MEGNTAKKSKDSICWNCARALNKPGCSCSWSRHLRPVKGWKATQSKIKYTNEGGTIVGQSSVGYIVHECPGFIRWQRFTSYARVIEAVCEHFGTHPGKVYKNPFGFFDKYTEETGIEVPKWAYMRARLGKENDSNEDAEEGDEAE